MMSLIEVQCPHCGAQGQIMLPPLGAIIVGPCPECHEMVAIFCGRVLPLSKDVMARGSKEERREHVLQVLNVFIESRVEQLFEGPAEDNGVLSDALGQAPEAEEAPASINVFGNAPTSPISEEEVDSFRSVDLKLIDNTEYFRAVFE